MSSNNKNLFDNLRGFINLIDQMRDFGVQDYVSLPRIAVCGPQSAGKSSLLEAIVGMDFLPRGSGIVTRRPLELRLQRSKDAVVPWGKFKDDPKEYKDFDGICNQITALTNASCGTNKGIVDDPIVLTIYSSDCPDLTIIDLPGMTRVAQGDQPKDIGEKIKNMVVNYCKDERTVILAVIPANADMANSEALEVAKDLDPTGTRTIGVITKIDIMDRGTDARSMLLNEEIPLRLGYVGVKGRSQYDINNKLKVADALMEESKYFSEHPVYSSLPPGLTGTLNLIDKLTNVLYNLIRANLPALRKEIMRRREDCENKLRALGPGIPTEENKKFEFVWKMADEFCTLFINEVNGKYDPRRADLTKKSAKYSFGSKINSKFEEFFDEFAAKDYSATEQHTDQEIQTVLTMYQGNSIPGFPSMDAFLYLITPKLELLKQPAYDLLEKVNDKLEKLVKTAAKKLFTRFPMIEGEIAETVINSLQEKKQNTKDILSTLMECEENYLFTNNEDYIANRQIVSKDKKKEKRIEAPGSAIIGELRQRIDSYFHIVSKNLKDTVPKIIGNFLIKSILKDIKFVLFESLSDPESFLNKMNEPSAAQNERNLLQKQYEVMLKAERKLMSDPRLMGETGEEEDFYALLEQKEQEFNEISMQNLANKPDVSNIYSQSEPQITKQKSTSKHTDIEKAEKSLKVKKMFG